MLAYPDPEYTAADAPAEDPREVLGGIFEGLAAAAPMLRVFLPALQHQLIRLDDTAVWDLVTAVRKYMAAAQRGEDVTALVMAEYPDAAPMLAQFGPILAQLTKQYSKGA